MSRQATVVVRCADQVPHLISTLETVKRQRLIECETVIVTDESTPDRARHWIAGLASQHRFQLAHANGRAPGLIRNAGARVGRAEFVVCVDAGERLDRDYLSTAASRLAADPSAELVTSWVEALQPGSGAVVEKPLGCDLAAICADFDSVHGASMFRRARWIELGGFDESLMSLVDHEFWIRLLSNGGTGVVLEAPLLTRPETSDSLYWRERSADVRLPAVAVILERHLERFAADPAAPLNHLERTLRRLRLHHLRLIARRDGHVAELELLKTRIEEARRALPPEGWTLVDAADLRRVSPVSGNWGYERGTPVDRYYIEQFLARHAADVQGAVLEVQEAAYTHRFGGAFVTQSEVIDLNAANPRATIIADLRCAPNVPSESFDCVILTQTLHVIADMAAVLEECFRILRPDGVLLATLPCVSRVCLEYGRDGDFWRVTEAGARELFSRAFPSAALSVESHGNTLVNTAFMYGLSTAELSRAEFEAYDPFHPAVVTVRAVKPSDPASPSIGPGRPGRATVSAGFGAVLLYHRVSAHRHFDPHGLVVTPVELREHLMFVKQRFRPIPLEELALAAARGAVPHGSIAVTFDDGYAELLQTAAPLLAALGVPATVFATTGRLDEPFEYWWDVLARVFDPAIDLPATLDVELSTGRRTLSTASPQERTAALWDLYHSLVAMSAEARAEVLLRLVSWSGVCSVDPDNRRMSSRELQQLAEVPGLTIGGHTCDHPSLPRLPYGQARTEISRNKARLEAILQRPVSTFAYPYGAYDTASIEAVRAAGFTAAVTCDSGPVWGGSNPLALPRVDVRATSERPFLLALDALITCGDASAQHS